MKKYFTILAIMLISSLSLLSQEDEEAAAGKAGKLQQRMQEYVQKRLGLSKAEAEKFSPIFLRYMLELRQTHRLNRADKPMLQYRVAELRIRFRNEFRQILDEQRANRVYEYQREFEDKIRQEIKERRQERVPRLETRKTNN